MSQVTLHIPDNKYPFFIELVMSIDFIKKIEVDEERTKKQILRVSNKRLKK
jgi:hypothetical protein